MFVSIEGALSKIRRCVFALADRCTQTKLAELFHEIKTRFEDDKEDDKEDGVTEFEKADLAEDFRRYSRR